MPILTLPAVVRSQNGLLSRTQAETAGLSRSAVRHRVGRGLWQEVLPGVFATFSGDLSHVQRLRAAVLYAGPRSLITGSAAGKLAGLKYVPDESTITVLIPADTRRKHARHVRVVRSTRMPAVASWTCPDQSTLPLAPVSRAVMDVARDIGLRAAQDLPRRRNGDPLLTTYQARATHQRALRDTRAIVCESVQRGLAEVNELAGELEAGPRHGSGLARRVLDDVLAGCRSAPECELRDLVDTCEDLPEPRWNVPIPGAEHVIPDACWPEARLIVEVDSAEWHRFGDAPERTEQRRAMLAALGWTVLPVSPRRLRAEPAVVLAEIVAAYQAGIARG